MFLDLIQNRNLYRNFIGNFMENVCWPKRLEEWRGRRAKRSASFENSKGVGGSRRPPPVRSPGRAAGGTSRWWSGEDPPEVSRCELICFDLSSPSPAPRVQTNVLQSGGFVTVEFWTRTARTRGIGPWEEGRRHGADIYPSDAGERNRDSRVEIPEDEGFDSLNRPVSFNSTDPATFRTRTFLLPWIFTCGLSRKGWCNNRQRQ